MIAVQLPVPRSQRIDRRAGSEASHMKELMVSCAAVCHVTAAQSCALPRADLRQVSHYASCFTNSRRSRGASWVGALGGTDPYSCFSSLRPHRRRLTSARLPKHFDGGDSRRASVRRSPELAHSTTPGGIQE